MAPRVLSTPRMKAVSVVRGTEIAIAVVLLMLSPTAQGADAYYRIPIMSLDVIEGSWPSETDATIHHWRSLPLFQPYATLEGEGEVYVDGDSSHRWTTSNGHAVAIRAPKDQEVLGTL